METVGERIRDIRKVNGLTQQEFGEIFGLSASHVGSVEGDRKKPSDMFLRFVAYRFGYDYEFVANGTRLNNNRVFEVRYNETRTDIDNFVSDKLSGDNNLSNLLSSIYLSYWQMLRGDRVLMNLGYDSKEYKQYLQYLNDLFSELSAIITDDLFLEQQDKKKYKEKIQAQYLLNLYQSSYSIQEILGKIANLYFECNDYEFDFEIFTDDSTEE